MMKKKILTILLCGILVLGLTGCGTDKEDTKTENNSNSSETSNTNSQNKKSILNLDIKTDIWKYIDNNVWDLSRMSSDFGWNRNEDSPIAQQRIVTTSGNNTVGIKFIKPTGSNEQFFTDMDHLNMFTIGLGDYACIVSFNSPNIDKFIKIKNSPNAMVPIEAIEITAYLMENSDKTIDKDFLLNLFENQSVCEFGNKSSDNSHVILNY